MKTANTRSKLFSHIVRGAGLFGVLLFLTGCVMYSAPVIPPQGGILTDVKAPLTTEFNGNPTGPMTKKASAGFTHYIHDFLLTGTTFAWEDVNIADIAKQGGIQEVSYADYELFSVLGVYARFTVNVYGN